MRCVSDFREFRVTLIPFVSEESRDIKGNFDEYVRCKCKNTAMQDPFLEVTCNRCSNVSKRCQQLIVWLELISYRYGYSYGSNLLHSANHRKKQFPKANVLCLELNILIMFFNIIRIRILHTSQRNTALVKVEY